MEEGEAHAPGCGSGMEIALCRLESTAGRQVAAILRAVGIADHHDLSVAPASQVDAVGRLVEDRGERVVGVG